MKEQGIRVNWKTPSQDQQRDHVASGVLIDIIVNTYEGKTMKTFEVLGDDGRFHSIEPQYVFTHNVIDNDFDRRLKDALSKDENFVSKLSPEDFKVLQIYIVDAL
jgi:hypothetical protein